MNRIKIDIDLEDLYELCESADVIKYVEEKVICPKSCFMNIVSMIYEIHRYKEKDDNVDNMIEKIINNVKSMTDIEFVEYMDNRIKNEFRELVHKYD